MKIDKILPLALIMLSMVVAGIFSYVAIQRPLSELEGIILQTFSLATGLIGSYIFGRSSAKDAAKEIIKPHARSAFRRLVSLYGGLSRLAYSIEDSKTIEITDSNKHLILDKLQAIVVEQISTAGDSLEDWNDLVPDDVRELRERLTHINGNGESE